MSKKTRRNARQDAEGGAAGTFPLTEDQASVLGQYSQAIQQIQQRAQAEIQQVGAHISGIMVAILSGLGVPRSEYGQWQPDLEAGVIRRVEQPAPAEQPHQHAQEQTSDSGTSMEGEKSEECAPDEGEALPGE